MVNECMALGKGGYTRMQRPPTGPLYPRVHPLSSYLGRHGSGEKQGLPLPGALLDQGLHLGGEAQVDQLIDLVHYLMTWDAGEGWVGG